MKKLYLIKSMGSKNKRKRKRKKCWRPEFLHVQTWTSRSSLTINLLEILKHLLTETRVRAVNKLSRYFWCLPKFENHMIAIFIISKNLERNWRGKIMHLFSRHIRPALLCSFKLHPMLVGLREDLHGSRAYSTSPPLFIFIYSYFVLKVEPGLQNETNRCEYQHLNFKTNEWYQQW